MPNHDSYRKTVSITIEACVTSVRSALAAQQGGADRVELCDNLTEGGTTPGPGSILAARRYLDIGLNVIIRPRGRDFLYTDLEFEIMRRDIEFCREHGVDGVVFGVQEPDGRIDTRRTGLLKEAAGSLSTTFHRAFDVCRDPFEALEALSILGIDRILTSGQQADAVAGADLIAQLVTRAGDRIVIMPGVGIDAGNIKNLISRTRAQEYHVYASRQFPGGMTFHNTRVFMGTDPSLSEYHLDLTDPASIRAIRDAADSALASHS